MSDYALVVMTSGPKRTELLEMAIESAMDALPAKGLTELWISDDGGDDAYRARLREQYGRWGFIVSGSARNHGYTQHMMRIWALIRERIRAPHVFFLEDDFTVDDKVDVEAMAYVLDTEPQLAQLVLLRQPWYPNERAAGGVMEALEREGIWMRYREAANGATWHEHKGPFSCNPMLMPRETAHTPWPAVPWSESRFGTILREAGQTFGYWGDRVQMCTHHGTEKAGHGY